MIPAAMPAPMPPQPPPPAWAGVAASAAMAAPTTTSFLIGVTSPLHEQASSARLAQHRGPARTRRFRQSQSFIRVALIPSSFRFFVSSQYIWPGPGEARVSIVLGDKPSSAKYPPSTALAPLEAKALLVTGLPFRSLTAQKTPWKPIREVAL